MSDNDMGFMAFGPSSGNSVGGITKKINLDEIPHNKEERERITRLVGSMQKTVENGRAKKLERIQSKGGYAYCGEAEVVAEEEYMNGNTLSAVFFMLISVSKKIELSK